MNMSLAVLGVKPLVAGFMGGQEILVVCLVILVLFGAKKIPEFAKGLGKGISEFKKASNEVNNELQQAMEERPVQTQKPTPPPAPAENANQTPTVTKI